uniref:Cycloartenol synthase n=1 Tax=Arundo donax TaxID=35708 RepID=A0A0A9FFQ3_ARUDO
MTLFGKFSQGLKISIQEEVLLRSYVEKLPSLLPRDRSKSTASCSPSLCIGSITTLLEIFDSNSTASSASAVVSDTAHPLSADERVHEPFDLWRCQ